MKQLIYKFTPSLKTKLWGGDRIALFKNEMSCGDRIGESWEISAVEGSETVVSEGEEKGMSLSNLCKKYGDRLLGNASICRFGNDFPLLVKIIDAHDDLSVQVHPDDDLAVKRRLKRGKTEMWYVVSSCADAKIYCGFTKNLSREHLTETVKEGKLKDYLGTYHSMPGDSYFIPGGRVHSIGAGNLLIEIQQSSDVTYRIDDFNRKDAQGKTRELHLDLAKDAIDYNVVESCQQHPGTPDKEIVPLVECKYFTTDVIAIGAKERVALKDIDSFRVVICVDGEVTVEAQNGERVSLQRGHSALVAAAAGNVGVTSGEKPSKMLLSYI